jgi:hypothetical protein
MVVHFAGNLGRAAQVINQRRMMHRSFDGVERGFLDDSGVQRSPAQIVAIGKHAVLRPLGPPMRLADGKYGVAREQHEP